MKLLVTSPMRTGSTWVHAVLCELLRPSRTDFVSSADQALRFVTEEVCVLKSHLVGYRELPALRGHFRIVRVLRNFKDCLISRALYCRHVRPAQKLPLRPAEAAAMRRCEGMDDRVFVHEVLSGAEVAEEWLREIAEFEVGRFDHTLYYEMLLHNAHDQFWLGLEALGLSERIAFQELDAALRRCSFARMRVNSDPGFVGSTGVGRWMDWLEQPLIDRLDARFFELRAALALPSRNEDAARVGTLDHGPVQREHERRGDGALVGDHARP
jgi:hypothetical protein